MLRPSEIFWHNVVDCLKKYSKTKLFLAQTIMKYTDFGKKRKSERSFVEQLRMFIRDKKSISDAWQVAIVEAIRIIDIDNFSTPVEFCDMYTIDFFKE